jgi:hypothetical protein
MRADGTILRQGRPETLDNPQRCPRSHPAARGGQSERRGARRVRARDIGARSRRDYRRSPPPRTRSRAGPAVKQHDCRRARCAPSSSYRLAWPPGSGQPHSRPQPQETRSSARSCGLEPRVWQLGLGRCPPQRRCLASGLRRVLNYLDARRGTATSETRSQRRAASHEPSVTSYDGVRVGDAPASQQPAWSFSNHDVPPSFCFVRRPCRALTPRSVAAAATLSLRRHAQRCAPPKIAAGRATGSLCRTGPESLSGTAELSALTDAARLYDDPHTARSRIGQCAIDQSQVCAR